MTQDRNQKTKEEKERLIDGYLADTEAEEKTTQKKKKYKRNSTQNWCNQFQNTNGKTLSSIKIKEPNYIYKHKI